MSRKIGVIWTLLVALLVLSGCDAVRGVADTVSARISGTPTASLVPPNPTATPPATAVPTRVPFVSPTPRFHFGTLCFGVTYRATYDTGAEEPVEALTFRLSRTSTDGKTVLLQEINTEESARLELFMPVGWRMQLDGVERDVFAFMILAVNPNSVEVRRNKEVSFITEEECSR